MKWHIPEEFPKECLDEFIRLAMAGDFRNIELYGHGITVLLWLLKKVTTPQPIGSAGVPDVSSQVSQVAQLVHDLDPQAPSFGAGVQSLPPMLLFILRTAAERFLEGDLKEWVMMILDLLDNAPE